MPGSDAGGQSTPLSDPPQSASDEPSDASPLVGNKVAAGTGETIMMMGSNIMVQSLEGIALRMERLGGALALADNGATVNCLTSPIGRIPGTTLPCFRALYPLCDYE